MFGVFAGLPSDGSPYLLFVYAAMLAWNLVSGGVTRAGTSLINDSSLVTKIYFPRAIIPIARTFSAVIDFLVAVVVGLVLMLALGVPIDWPILALPVFAFAAWLLAVGVSLAFSSLSVYYRDFSYALPFLLQVWLYASPVAYATSLIPDRWLWLYGLNPMVGLIEGFRWGMLGGEFPTMLVAEAAVVGSLMVVAGAVVFARVERHFADYI